MEKQQLFFDNSRYTIHSLNRRIAIGVVLCIVAAVPTHCFRKASSADMYSKILANRVRELKETQKGVEVMCNEIEEIYSEGIERGERRGELRKAKDTALSMAADGMEVEKIAYYLKVNTETIEEWLEESLSVVH